jgi:hypothetical protein
MPAGALPRYCLNLIGKFEDRFGQTAEQRGYATSVMGLSGGGAPISSGVFSGPQGPSASLSQARANAIAKASVLLVWFVGGLTILSHDRALNYNHRALNYNQVRRRAHDPLT